MPEPYVDDIRGEDADRLVKLLHCNTAFNALSEAERRIYNLITVAEKDHSLKAIVQAKRKLFMN